MDYLLAQSLSLTFYLITLIIYNRARKEYAGGKIAAAIKLIMVFMVILFFSDFVDYFFILMLPLGQDTILILKIILKLIAICVLFFGGLRFFVSKPAGGSLAHQPAPMPEMEAEAGHSVAAHPTLRASSTVVLKEVPRPKPTLGRYEIIEQIARGGMGIVYKGRDPKLNRLTAVKTMRFTDEFDEDQVDEIKKQFYNEAEVVATLAHANIVTIYDVGEDLDLSYLAMEYLEGESLDQYTREGHLLPIRKCIDVIKQVCDGLEYAHRHGVVHRDIKPGNIMLLKDGLVKVTDFGIARVATSSKTQAGIIKGTPYYMSPEQAQGMRVSAPSDIFSLGVVFYQLLTGRLPFDGENMASILYQVTTANPEQPTTYNPELDKETVRILNRSLEKDLQKRYQTAKQMSEDLQLLLQRLEAEAYEEDVEGEVGAVFEASDWGQAAEEISDAADFEVELEQENAFGVAEADHIPELDKAAAKEADADLEDPDAVPEIDMTFDEAVSEQKQEDEFGFPDIAQTPEIDIGFEGETDPEKEDRAADGAALEVTSRGKSVADLWKRVMFKRKGKPSPLSRNVSLLIIVGFCILALLGMYNYLAWRNSNLEKQMARKMRKSHIDRTKMQRNKKQIEPKQVKQAQLKRPEKQKQHEGDELASIAEEKKKQQEQLIKAEKEKRAERERLARIAKEKQAKRERLARIAKEKQAERERLAIAEKGRQEALKKNEVGKIDLLISQAKESLELKNYLEAKNRYEAALEIIEDSVLKDEKLFLKYERKIKNALTGDDIAYGAKGYIKYKNKWLTPDEYERKLIAEGYIKYKGKFKHYLKLKKIVKQMTYPGIQSFLMSKYSGQNIHKMQIKYNKLVLKQNTSVHSHLTIAYKWEVWTFYEIGEGECSFDLFYYVENDKWNITKGCE